MPSFTISIQQSTRSFSQRQEKEIKIVHIRKEEVILSLFAYNTIMNIEISKDSTKKLKLSNDFSKVSGDKYNTQKTVTFLYTNNEQLKRKLRKQFHLQWNQKE